MMTKQPSVFTTEPASIFAAMSIQSAPRRRVEASVVAAVASSKGSGSARIAIRLLGRLGLRRLGGLDAQHLHVEMEGLAGEGMVEIEDHRLVFDFLDDDRPRFAG